MKRLTKLPIVSILALSGCVGLSAASAGYHPSGLSGAISEIERSTDALILDFKQELRHRGLWKPRGVYSTIYSATFRMEEYGDSLRKYAEKRASLSSIARVAHKIDHQARVAQDAARHCRVSRQFHSNLARVSRATQSLVGVCDHGHGRGRGVLQGGRELRYDERPVGRFDNRIYERQVPVRRYERGRARGQASPYLRPTAPSCPPDPRLRQRSTRGFTFRF